METAKVKKAKFLEIDDMAPPPPRPTRSLLAPPAPRARPLEAGGEEKAIVQNQNGEVAKVGGGFLSGNMPYYLAGVVGLGAVGLVWYMNKKSNDETKARMAAVENAIRQLARGFEMHDKFLSGRDRPDERTGRKEKEEENGSQKREDRDRKERERERDSSSDKREKDKKANGKKKKTKGASKGTPKEKKMEIEEESPDDEIDKLVESELSESESKKQ